MKGLKVKIDDIKIKSFITSSTEKTKKAINHNGGGYTWVG